MMQACPWPVRELITHSGDKVLLDQVLGYDAEKLQAEATVKADSVYLKSGSEPAWIGLEYMAQAVAAFAGIRARQASGQPRVGMLIGTRRYSVQVANFPVGLRLLIDTQVLLEDDNGLCVFQCAITDQASGSVIAECNLNAYQPNDIDHYLQTTKRTS